MRYWISLFFIVYSAFSLADDKTTLYDFRYWSAPDHTRIVIDKEEDTLFNIKSFDDYLIISFDDAKVLSETFSNLFFKDSRIKKVRIKRDKETIKLIVHINNKFSTKHFTLKPNAKYKYHRLVVDIIDSELKITKKITKPEVVTPIQNQKIILIDAVHSVGGMFVLDCIASGAIWIDMEKCGVDVLVSAPQKGWSASPAFGMVMLSKNASKKIHNTQSTSFSCDLLKWLQIMQTYENGGHAYHATMPTDAIKHFRDTINETAEFGFDRARDKQQELGDRVRELLNKHHFISVAAEGFHAPGVVVSYTKDQAIHNGSKFKDLGIQIAAGVPLQCDEGEDYQTFRLGLFGLDKLKNVDAAVQKLEDAFNNL
ncbi:aminotransferase class V-fold PLP-dependent enzyme [Candidatus Thioglobus sp.]|nr:aminotransferase class V-fold PLP-dependent enzyme [Candidatus Thioglobus sp.]